MSVLVRTSIDDAPKLVEIKIYQKFGCIINRMRKVPRDCIDDQDSNAFKYLWVG